MNDNIKNRLEMNRIMSIEKTVTIKNIEKMVKRMSIKKRDYWRKRTMEMLDCQKYDAPFLVGCGCGVGGVRRE